MKQASTPMASCPPESVHIGLIGACNHWLDRLPHERLRFGQYSLPTFLFCALVGLVSGTITIAALAIVCGLDLLLALALVPITLAPAIVVSLVRQRRSGVESWVLLEHLLIALATGSLALWLGGAPILTWLDIYVLALCPLFAWGRVGCACTGCCHGVRAAIGILHPHLSRIHRYFPAQLLECGFWWLALLLGLVLLAAGPPGNAAASVLLAYAIARFALEGVRADERPIWLGLSESRWLSLLLGAGAVVTLLSIEAVEPANMILAAVGSLVAVLLWATRRRWLLLSEAIESEALARLREVAQGLAERGPDLELHRATIGPLGCVASWVELKGGIAIYVTLSHARGELDPVAAQIGFEAFAEGLGIVDAEPDVFEARPGLFVASFSVTMLSWSPAQPEADRGAVIEIDSGRFPSEQEASSTSVVAIAPPALWARASRANPIWHQLTTLRPADRKSSD